MKKCCKKECPCCDKTKELCPEKCKSECPEKCKSECPKTDKAKSVTDVIHETVAPAEIDTDITSQNCDKAKKCCKKKCFMKKFAKKCKKAKSECSKKGCPIEAVVTPETSVEE